MLVLILKICLTIYCGCMFLALLGILQKKKKKKKKPSTSESQILCEFSILIPFRNEHKRLGDLLNSIQQIDYPKEKFELIFIDDHSIDESEKLINEKLALHHNLNFDILKLDSTKKGKKHALLKGVKKGKFAYIITTDADCTLPKNWLTSYNEVFSKNLADLAIGTVSMKPNKSWLQSFQYYDYIAMQAFNIGISEIHQPVLCSGANLAYKKELIEKLQPYKENSSIASGDDSFLLDAAIKSSLKIEVLLDARNLVFTKNAADLKTLIQQRKRWLAKTPKSDNLFTKILSLIILFGNSAWLILLVYCFIDKNHLSTFIIWTALKLAIEFFVTLYVMKFLNLSRNNLVQMKLQLLYPFALLILTVNIFFSRNRIWKEREF